MCQLMPEQIFCLSRRHEAQILTVSKPTTTKKGEKSAGMLDTVIPDKP